jgi:antibiotic biosynthesis monooxygenase (ABM) superfamily enzyme
VSRELRRWKVALLVTWAVFAVLAIANATAVSAGWYCPSPAVALEMTR